MNWSAISWISPAADWVVASRSFAPIWISGVCRQTVEEIAALHPQRVVNFDASGRLEGQWDRARITQAFSNVISNAVQHGSATTPVNVVIRGDVDQVCLTVQNCGAIIPANELDRIFNPMHRLEADKPVAPRENLGLGLYITERIVAAHAGTIDVESSEEKGTTFTIRLPKRLPINTGSADPSIALRR